MAMSVAVTATLWAWVALEIGLVVRDRVRGMGSTARDRGTRGFTMLACVAASILAQVLAGVLNADMAMRLPVPGRGVPDLAIMWVGLALRVWAVAVLGSSFRTTVEVDAGQAVVERGPYRLIRHPSYTGILLVFLGFGLALGNLAALAVMLLVPLYALSRRIAVEEAELLTVLGTPYREYRQRTKRLIPYVW